MTRKTFMHVAAGACATPLFGQSRKRNLVFILSDDHRYDMMGTGRSCFISRIRPSMPGSFRPSVTGAFTPPSRSLYPKSMANTAESYRGKPIGCEDRETPEGGAPADSRALVAPVRLVQDLYYMSYSLAVAMESDSRSKLQHAARVRRNDDTGAGFTDSLHFLVE